MAALNFKHLRYLWAVARTGSIARASEQLHVTSQSISSQLRELEEALGAELVRRVGRGLEVTPAGRRAVEYADRIFGLESDLLHAVRELGPRATLNFRVGIADSVPKSLAYRVVEPALRAPERTRLVCREGRLVALLSELAVDRLDMVIADRVMPAETRVRAYNHLLGESDLTVFGARSVVSTLPRKFPQLLHGAPFLMPGEGAAVRVALEQWFDASGVRPVVVGDFDDGALMKAFGQGGAGLFAAPTAIASYVARQYQVQAVGRIAEVVERFYAITPERRLRHAATVAISEAATRDVFRETTSRGDEPGPVEPRRRRSRARVE